VVRSSVTGVPAKGRDTMGVIFAKPDKNDRIIAVARNSERGLEGEESAGENDTETPAPEQDDVTLAEASGPHEGSAETESVPVPESDESSGNAELDEDNTGGNA
jgi:DNA gyrase subunit A